MNQIFAIGKEQVEISIPDENVMAVLHANLPDTPLDEQKTIHDSLENPIGSPKLREIVKPGEKIVIVTSDISRPMPSYKVLPAVLEELKKASVKNEDVTIVLALGSHRGHTDEEKKKICGEKVFNEYTILDSNGEMVHLGVTENGTPVDIFKPVADADRVICLGNIEYHYFAGDSGGMKAIMPGVSTREAIQKNHSRMVDPNAATGKIDGNPVRNDIDSVREFVPVDFIVNVVLDEHKQIRHCVSGDVIEAHRTGCRLLDAMYSLKIPERPDIVIVSAGGFPKDMNLYQAQKALDNAGKAVKEGGSIVWIASGIEGLGEKHFEDWMLSHENPLDMIPHIEKEFVLGGHKAAAIAMVMKRADIYLYTDLQQEFVEKLHFRYSGDLQKTVDELLTKYGKKASVLLMPYGGSTLPVPEK